MTYAQREAELDAIAAIITKNDGRSLDQVDDIPIQGASWPSRTPVRWALLVYRQRRGDSGRIDLRWVS